MGIAVFRSSTTPFYERRLSTTGKISGHEQGRRCQLGPTIATSPVKSYRLNVAFHPSGNILLAEEKVKCGSGNDYISSAECSRETTQEFRINFAIRIASSAAKLYDLG